MDKQRIFRALVCFVLICVFLINTSPIRIRVEATGLEPAAVAGTAVFFWFMLMMGGIVIEPTVEALNYIDQTAQINIGQEIAQLPADQVEDAQEQWQRSIADLMYWGENDFSNDDDSDDNDPSDPEIPEDPSTAEETKHSAYVDKYGNIVVGYALKGMIARWWYDIISSGVFEAYTGAEAPEGYAYYNGLLLPVLPSEYADYPCFVTRAYDGDIVLGIIKEQNLSFGVNGSYICTFRDGSLCDHQKYIFIYRSDSWSGPSIPSFYTNTVCGTDQLIWSSVDVSGDSGIIFPGMEPTSKATAYIEPDMYFGDYSDQIENGTFDEESVKLPAFDFSSLLESSDSAYSNMQQVYNQVYDQQMSYNDFVNQIQADNSVVNPDPGPGSDIVNPSDPLPEPPPALGDYALDLTEFFPFCIPYDIKEFLSLLSAAPEAPEFKWTIYIKSWNWGVDLEIDLSPWDEVAALFRKLELLAFIVGLGFVTREKFLRG